MADFAPIDVDEDLEVSSDNEEDPIDEIVFVLDPVPGAPEAKEIIIEPDNNEVEVDAEPADNNVWKWEHATFLPWLQRMFQNVPKHTGHDTTGLEKAIAYFEALNKEITKAMRSDFKNEIDAAKAEKAREEIETGVDRLLDRLEKVNNDKFKKHNKKSWAITTGLIKEGKSTAINGITITVPLLISRIARVCINGVVSAGHDMNDLFDGQVKEYNLDKREQAELCQLLDDMGWPIHQDRGYPVGTHVDMSKSDNWEWSQQFRG
jgi:hypothetical protein